MTVATVEPATPVAGHGLSAGQRSHFDTFGFLVLRGVFAGEVAELIAGFEEALAQAPPQVVHCPQFYAPAQAHEERPRLAQFEALEGSSGLARLRTDPRVTDVADQLVGHGHVATDSVNLFNCDTHWHNDGLLARGGRNVLFLWYLDPLTADSGALRVIPGSHRDGPFRTALDAALMVSPTPTPEVFGARPDDVPGVVVDVEPGDAVVIDYRLYHASFHGGVDRRVVTVGFSPPVVPAIAPTAAPAPVLIPTV